VGKPEAIQPKSSRRVRAWLELVRAPNLLTVPGDPVAGYLLAAGVAAAPDLRLALAVAASLAFYAAGLVLNDVADLAEDRAQRPARPLPSGRISETAARRAGFLLMALGLALCTGLGLRGMLVGSVLSVVILAYDLGGKRSVVLGPILMGLCRLLSLVLGAALVGTASRALLVAGALLNGYIVLLTYLARTEMQRARRGGASWLPAILIVVGMVLFVRVAPVAGENQMRMAGSFFVAFILASVAALRLQNLQSAPAAIGLMIGGLLGLQAAFSLGAGAGVWSLVFGLAFLLLLPINRWLSTRFYSS
jgi:4-hydroxybenzoate polyprenyltransferase